MVAASPFARHAAQWTPGGAVDPGTQANGFAAYLAASNPMGVAHQIQVPTLIVNADDDPVGRPPTRGPRRPSSYPCLAPFPSHPKRRP